MIRATSSPAARIVQTAVCLAALLGTGSCAEAKKAASGEMTTHSPGVLTVAAELPAPGFWEGSDPARVNGGFEWALAGELADELGLRLAVQATTFADILAGRLGNADLALAEVSVTEERRERVDFSLTYFTSSPTVLTRSAADDIIDLATAKERRWVVEAGTTEEQYLLDVIRPDEPATAVPNEATTIQMVLNRSADAALLDLPSALAAARAHTQLVVPGRFDHDESLAPLLPKDSANTASVDRALRALTADGTVQRLEDRWLRPKLAADPDSVPVIRARR